jgi:signal transduction histidine kinase
MRPQLESLAREYSVALGDYISGGSEQALLQAYQAGRTALAQGVGVLDLAAIHQQSLVATLLERLAPEASQVVVQRASQFFAESLAAFELTHRGLQETTASLRDSNRELQQRVRSVLEEHSLIRNQLEEQRRLERLKNEFISIVSHELRTPLTSIHGSLGLVNRGHAGELPPKACQLIGIAYRNSERLVRLATDLLDLQKIESGSLTFDVRSITLASLLEAALDANQPYCSAFEVEIVIGDVPAGEYVRTDADRLLQVLTNLLSNAAKFSPPHSQVTLAAERRGGEIRVCVRDRGPGIPEEFRARIFQRFAQADSSTTRRREGTGLGLNISRAIIERLGGRIGFESREGVGTTFFIDLPVAEALPQLSDVQP